MTFAMEKEEEDKLFSRWVGLAQYEVSFEEFKQQLKPVKMTGQKPASVTVTPRKPTGY